MSAKKLPNEEDLIEELISMEHPVKPHHEPEPEESDYEFEPESILG